MATYPTYYRMPGAVRLVLHVQIVAKVAKAKIFADFFFGQSDTNNDGVIDKAEALAAGISEEQFKAIDANGDGVLTQEEYDDWEEKHHGACNHGA